LSTDATDPAQNPTVIQVAAPLLDNLPGAANTERPHTSTLLAREGSTDCWEAILLFEIAQG
jgi:hypothetical protein